jgi:hypothetical protein
MNDKSMFGTNCPRLRFDLQIPSCGEYRVVASVVAGVVARVEALPSIYLSRAPDLFKGPSSSNSPSKAVEVSV